MKSPEQRVGRWWAGLLRRKPFESPVWVFNNMPAGARVDTRVSCPLKWPPGSVGARVLAILNIDLSNAALGAVCSRESAPRRNRIALPESAA